MGRPPGVALRDAEPDDAAAIAELISQLGYDTRPEEMSVRLDAIGADGSYHTIVAVIGSAVVGIAGVGIGHFYERNGLYCRLLVLVVHESQRGNGIGRVLLHAAESWALGRGAAVMIINSGHQRVGAHALYEASGYSSTGFRFIKSLSDVI